jgi:hypothetical protein
MEGSLPKNNSKAASKNLGVEGTEKKIINKKPLIREKQENKPKKRGLYEIRTMKHDLDRAKGKNVSTLSLTEESLSAVNKESKIKEIRSGGIKSIDALTLEDSFKEGSIDFDAKKKRSFKKPSLISLKNISGKKTILKLAVALIIIIFIGGAGFYFYKSGALPSFGGIKEIFNDLFNRTTPDDEAPIIPPATSTPDIPIQPEPTSTPPIVDDSKSKYFPAFFNPDEEEIIKVDMLEEIYPKLKASFENGLKEESFKRIIVLAHNDFSSIGLAQVWKTLKTLVLGEKYTELISAEITESWGLAMPRDVDRKLSEIYNLFFYGQPENGPRAVLIFKIDDITGLKDEMFLWEETMIYDLKKLFLGADYEEAASADYLDNIYKDINIRYLNLPEHDLTIDYAIIPDKNYLILSTSRESIWATIDKILGAGAVAVDDDEDEFAGWKTYRNEKYGFEVSYPGDWKIKTQAEYLTPTNITYLSKEDDAQEKVFFPGAEDEYIKAVYDITISIEEQDFLDSAIENYDTQEIKIDSINGIRWEEAAAPSSGSAIVTAFPYNDMIYVITYTALAHEDTHLKFIDTYSKILKTLRFPD